MAETPINRAIRKRTELQGVIRDAMHELGEINKFIHMYSQYASPEELGLKVDAGEGPLGRAGSGMAQPVFEELVSMILREIGRPMQSGEVVEEFRRRGHPIGGLNEVKTAWNRLWEAKVRGSLVHLPPLGYWLPNEPLPENVAIPQRTERKKPRTGIMRLPARRGAPRRLTPEKIKAAEAMLLAGKTVKEVAAELGGISRQAIYMNIPRETRDLLKLKAESVESRGEPETDKEE